MVRHRLIGLLATGLAAGAPAATITVNTTRTLIADDGVCTLVEAITAVNSNVASGAMPGECAAGDPAPAVDTIAFAIPADDSGCSAETHVCTIVPATALPVVTNPVTIDGYTQPGTHANTLAIGDDAILLIEIDGSSVNPVLNFAGAALGVANDASGSTLRGLVIDHIASSGISCGFGNCANDLVIAGNFLGVDPGGTTMNGSAGSFPVYPTTESGMVLGGEAPADRNLVAGGVLFSICSNTIVEGNYFDVDRTGTTALQPAPTHGLDIENSDHITVGGAAPGAANVFGTWASNGIQIATANSTFEPPNAIIVQGNFIGTDASGMQRLSPGQVGISIGETLGNTGAGTGNVIGGSAPGAGNVIAGAAIAGILIQTDETDLAIEGNAIGTDASGMLDFANGAGIIASGGGAIGGTDASQGNRIAFNRGPGIVISPPTSLFAMLGNAIYANDLLGISLSGGGTPTPNDDGDADTGPNGFQNYPVVSLVTIDPHTAVHVSGRLNSTADTAFRLEFFANAGCDPSGNGEGEIFLGSLDVTTSGNDATFGPLDFAVPPDRHVITATATDPGGDTSEFSACGNQDTIFSDGFDGD
ncbi:MAG TPA: hypothetical protein VFV97_12715 [Rhodanobacteraceae bacterium]|nr:hypothetical protein [Rhodanobacteraceae bacterium]